MTTPDSIMPEGWAKPVGFAHGMSATGRIVATAGQVGWNERSEIVGEAFPDQFDQALANVLAVVSEAGGTPESIARLTIYVVDKAEYLAAQKAVGEKYRARMGRHYPAMTLVEVRSLLEDGAKVEIVATAVIAD